MKSSCLPKLHSLSNRRDIARYGITAVYTPPDAQVDIVLVHGLNGSPDLTWTSPEGTFWPQDLLPEALRGVPANILVYGYNADVYSRHNNRSASDNFIHQHAQTLVSSLSLFRKGEGRSRNPIIWVAHSLGGILVKRALLYANDIRAEHLAEYRGIYISTYGIVFLGTPHTGSDGAKWGLILQGMSDAILPRKFFQCESILLKTLTRDNETLQTINNHFLDIYERFRIHMVHENHKTDLKVTKCLVVDPNSASPQLPGVTYYGIEATHAGMCKFSSANAPGFNAISNDIRLWVMEAPVLIQRRWAMEDHEHSARLQNQFKEHMCPFATSTPPPAYSSSPATAVRKLTAEMEKESMEYSRSPASSNPPPPYTVGHDTVEPYATEVNTVEPDTTPVNTTPVNTMEVSTTEVSTTEVNTTEVNTTEVNTTEVNTVMLDTAKRMAVTMLAVPPQPLRLVFPPGKICMARNMHTKAQLQGIEVPVVFKYPPAGLYLSSAKSSCSP